jgi:hypothetical protein
MEMDRLKTLLEKFRVTAQHDKMRTMSDVVEEVARIVNDLDRRLKAIEGQGGGATATEVARHSSGEIVNTQPEDGTLQKPHKSENKFDEEPPEFELNEPSSIDDLESFVSTNSRTSGDL